MSSILISVGLGKISKPFWPGCIGNHSSNQEEAEILRRIFDPYVQGNGVRKIKRYLEEPGIKTVAGKSEWSTSTIGRILSNEKYVGEVLMQKTYTSDFLTALGRSTSFG